MTNFKSKYHYATFSTVIRAAENYLGEIEKADALDNLN
jgi:hypothetical protein